MDKQFIIGSILGFVATFSILYFYKFYEDFAPYNYQTDKQVKFTDDDLVKFNKAFEKKVYGIEDETLVIPNKTPIKDFDITEFNKKFTLNDTVKQPLPANADIPLVNSNDDATGRAPQDSLYINNQVKYKNAFYYEYDNEEYLKRLKVILNIRHIFDEGEWYHYNVTVNTPNDILMAYNKCIDIISKRLNDNNTLLLPDQNKVPIQIVHDVLLKYYRNHDNPKLFAFDIQLVLYRQSKYQGKHIELRVVYDKRYESLFVTDVKLLGVVSEDQIGMFPVVATNPFDIDQLSTKDTKYPEIIPAEDYSIINDKTGTGYWQVTGYDQNTIDTLKKRARLNILEQGANLVVQ